MNDQTAQMGFQMGQKAMGAAAEQMEQSVSLLSPSNPPIRALELLQSHYCSPFPTILTLIPHNPKANKHPPQINRYVSISALKHYFNVSTPYVLRKLLLVLFPWRHKPWSREQRPSTAPTAPGQNGSYQYYFLPPRDDLNSPDMYIPVMAFVTYILLSTLLAGLRGAFHPEVMGLTATTAFAVVAVEILGLKFGTYILSISNDSQLLDLVAYSGYKFVGVIVTLVVAEILNRGQGTGGWAGWTVFTYTFLANAFFLVHPSFAPTIPLPPSLPPSQPG